MSSDSDDGEGMSYEGTVDASGLPHGRGTLCMGGGCVYEGRFRHGERQGRGTLTNPDGSFQAGVWDGDELQGAGSYGDEDGNVVKGTWCEGEIEGPATEEGPGGAVTFQGTFRRGRRDGAGWALQDFDSGEIEGHWTRGVLGGPATYTFPLGNGRLKGLWQDNEMAAAEYVPGDPGAWRRRADAWRVAHPTPGAPEPGLGGRLYCYDPSTPARISRDPLLRDPYEVDTVEVRASCERAGGEGLFAARDLRPGELAAAYNGIRLTHAEVDGREWSLNDNTMTLDDDTVLDVPNGDVHVYCASLGHKANHARDNNAVYAPFVHPRFGFIKSVRCIRPVKKGEEITVCYGYDLQGEDDVPAWYRAYCERG